MVKVFGIFRPAWQIRIPYGYEVVFSLVWSFPLHRLVAPPPLCYFPVKYTYHLSMM